MESKELINSVAEKISCSPAEVNKMTDALIEVIKERCGLLDVVAIPGFGAFGANKYEEKIVVNPETGKRKLVPPSIVLNFKPSALLKSKMRDYE